MSQVRIEKKLLVEHVNDREGLRERQKDRIGRVRGWLLLGYWDIVLIERGCAVDHTQPTASVMAGLAGLRNSFEIR